MAETIQLRAWRKLKYHDPEPVLRKLRLGASGGPRRRCGSQLSAFPCYVARGRFDPGVYVSVERSDAYESFRPGLFVVIAASGEPGSAEVASSLTKARAAHPDAYVKQEKVDHGCMH